MGDENIEEYIGRNVRTFHMVKIVKSRGRETQPIFFCVILHRLSPTPVIWIWKTTNFSPDQLKVVPDKELESSDHFQKFFDITL